MTESGAVKLVPKRRGWGGQTAFPDWVNFTFHESTLTRTAGPMVSDDEFVISYSAILQRIFGFGITSICPNGRNFYQKSYVLGDGFGFVCYGGQRNTMLTMLSGEGLAAAKSGWESRLHEFLGNAIQARITRIDLAHDDFAGTQYSVDRAKAEFENGHFNSGGRMPDCEQRGNWFRPNGRGRTFYVGHRVNGKFCRVYEKGKQLGDVNSPWVRVEVEFKSVDRVIPLDVLLKPGEYLAASYPAFCWINEEMTAIKTVKKSIETSYEAGCKWLKHQCGSWLAILLAVEGSPEKVLAKVAEFKKMPERLRIPSWENSPVPLHEKIIESIKAREFMIRELVAEEAPFVLTEPAFE